MVVSRWHLRRLTVVSPSRVGPSDADSLTSPAHAQLYGRRSWSPPSAAAPPLPPALPLPAVPSPTPADRPALGHVTVVTCSEATEAHQPSPTRLVPGPDRPAGDAGSVQARGCERPSFINLQATRRPSAPRRIRVRSASNSSLSRRVASSVDRSENSLGPTDGDQGPAPSRHKETMSRRLERVGSRRQATRAGGGGRSSGSGIESPAQQPPSGHVWATSRAP